jgi:hypothetical protein
MESQEPLGEISWKEGMLRKQQINIHYAMEKLAKII